MVQSNKAEMKTPLSESIDPKDQGRITESEMMPVESREYTQAEKNAYNDALIEIYDLLKTGRIAPIDLLKLYKV